MPLKPFFVVIRLTNISKSFGSDGELAVSDISFEVETGEFLVIIGESGCGKTTTLKMINRLIEPTSGRIHVNDEDTSTADPVRLRRGIGYVFQQIGLFPHLTVGENIAIVPTLLKWERDDISLRVTELLEMMGLAPDEFRDRLPANLSGGQQQRVGVARALAARPKIMLMDEPFGALDPLTRIDLQGEYRRLHDRLELTTVMVTHDITEGLLLADRIIVMQAGKVVEIGSPHDLLTAPKHGYTSTLMSRAREQADQVEALTDPDDGVNCDD